jgi:hypothetical protein
VSAAKCWICGGAATTREHSTKRSDLKALFGEVSQSRPLFMHNDRQKNRRIGSLDADKLKSEGRICDTCNNARTQAHDRAWERLSAHLRTRTPPIAPGVVVSCEEAFPGDAIQQMLNVHLYFLKLFGCHITAASLPIDIAPFSKATMHGTPHPGVYLKFGHVERGRYPRAVGMTDVHIMLDT